MTKTWSSHNSKKINIKKEMANLEGFDLIVAQVQILQVGENGVQVSQGSKGVETVLAQVKGLRLELKKEREK